MNEQVEKRLKATVEEHGGLIWGLDGLQPEGHGTLLYVLYEVLSGTPVAALQADHPTTDELVAWLQPYRTLPYAALATLSDGEDTLIAALKTCWPDAPHQRCQEHVLGNIAEGALKEDSRLRKQMREDLGGLAKVPMQCEAEVTLPNEGPPEPAPLFAHPFRPTR